MNQFEMTLYDMFMEEIAFLLSEQEDFPFKFIYMHPMFLEDMMIEKFGFVLNFKDSKICGLALMLNENVPFGDFYVTRNKLQQYEKE